MIKGLLYLAILTAATVISWIGFSIYHNQTTSTIDSATQIRITPIPGEFDRETIEKIRTKRVIDANLNQERELIITTPDPQDETVSSPSAEVEL